MCGKCRSAIAPKRQRTTTRHRPPAKRTWRRTYGQVGGVLPGLLVGIGKASYWITKALGEHEQKQAKEISAKRRRAVDESYARGKPKRYAGESFNCSIM